MASDSNIRKAYGAWVLTRKGATEGERKAAEDRLRYFMKERGVTNEELMSFNASQNIQSQKKSPPPSHQQPKTHGGGRWERNEEAFRRKQAKETQEAARKRYENAQRAAASQKIQIANMNKQREEWQRQSDALHARPKQDPGRAWNGKKKGFSIWDIF